MSECSLSGRGRGHVSNFHIVDLENFACFLRCQLAPLYTFIIKYFLVFRIEQRVYIWKICGSELASTDEYKEWAKSCTKLICKEYLTAT